MAGAEHPRPRRPALPGAALFGALASEQDTASAAAAAERAARLLVRGARADLDAEVVARVINLADSEGIEEIAELWADADPSSLAGCLWRLYLLRTWIHADPVGAAREFDAGRRLVPVQEAIAGVVDPPGPDEVRDLADRVLRGVVEGDFADALFRAAAFARVAAAGRAHFAQETQDQALAASAERLAVMAKQLNAAGHQELSGGLE
jgi:hypothetical protein